MYQHYIMNRFSSKCHILEFSPTEYRFDATIGTLGKLERLSTIKGEPHEGETALAKINGGFFSMNGSTEYIGTFVDDGLYYNPYQEGYPTVIFWKDSNKLTIEQRPGNSRLVYYQQNAHWAIGVPWTLIVDGKVDYIYSKEKLIAMFGHPWLRAPRTLLGQKEDGTIVWAVIDGRRPDSRGFTIEHSSSLMSELGCVIAVNLDGGGSSEMIVEDVIVNRPSDGRERGIGTAFMMYGKKEEDVLQTMTKQELETLIDQKITDRFNGLNTAVPDWADAFWKWCYDNDLLDGTCPQGVVTRAQMSVIAKKLVDLATGTTSTTEPTPEEPKPEPPVEPEPPATEPIIDEGVVTATALNVRKGPGTEYDKIGSLYKDAKLHIVEKSNGWLRFPYEESFGWVSGDYVTLLKPEPVHRFGKTTENLKLRAGAATTYEHLCTIPAGTRLELLDETDGWYNVTYEDQTGWCSGDYIEIQ